LIGKTEILIATSLLGLGYSESSDYFEDHKNTIINYYCNHYKKIYEADIEHINPEELYDEIFQTCDDLRSLVINKNSVVKGSINFKSHLNKTSEARKKFFKEWLSPDHNIRTTPTE